MSAKLDKIGADLEKARAKRMEWETREKELETRYKEQENAEICDVTRSYNLTPDQLAELLRMVQNTMPESVVARETTDSFHGEEEETHEE
ncbi:MAG: DUF4315 family protein [Clostridiales bacterium]|nr:DUF4315 family protein [Clostridiales bacterium]